MGKLSVAQKEALEFLYDGDYDPSTEEGLSVRTLESLATRGLEGRPFIEEDDDGIWFITKFGKNIVKMMRGEIKKKKKRKRKSQ